MARKNISPKQHARKFQAANKRTKQINQPRYIPRGGIRF